MIRGSQLLSGLVTSIDRWVDITDALTQSD
jgi:hypothetical protein